MDCEAVLRVVDEFREGTLSEEESSDIRQHVAGCGNCRALLSAAEEFDKRLRDAMTSRRPPSDFAARTAMELRNAVIEPTSVRPIVWVVAAAAACLVLAVGIRQTLPRRGEGSRGAESAAVVSRTPSSPVGSAFVIAGGGRLIPYRGRTSVKIIWNIWENAWELEVDAFPGEGAR